MDEAIRVLIADDHEPFRVGLRTLLRATHDTEAVGEAATGQEAVNLAVGLQPDVVLMDLQMPGMNGIAATRQILHTSPHIAILVLTMFEGDDSVLYASLHQVGIYPGTGAAGEGGATTVNVPLRAGSGDDEWLDAFATHVEPAVARFEPELVLVSAG